MHRQVAHARRHKGVEGHFMRRLDDVHIYVVPGRLRAHDEAGPADMLDYMVLKMLDKVRLVRPDVKHVFEFIEHGCLRHRLCVCAQATSEGVKLTLTCEAKSAILKRLSPIP
jgi:hypothetical protein